MGQGGAVHSKPRALCKAGYHRKTGKILKYKVVKSQCIMDVSRYLEWGVSPFTLALVILMAMLSSATASDRPSDLEAAQLLNSGGGPELLQLKPVDPKIAKSTEFSTMLEAYVRDVAEERSVTECRLWIDVSRHKSISSQRSGKLKGRIDDGDGDVGRNDDLLSQYGGKCATVNEEFGVEVSGGGSHDLFASNSYKCTHAPWYAEAKVQRVTANRSGSTTLKLRFKQSVIQKAGDRIPAVIRVRPRGKTWLMDELADGKSEISNIKQGDRVTLLCLAKGMQMQVIQEFEEPHYEFIQGPWNVAVSVHFRSAPLKPLGVTAEVHLQENLAVTYPAMRVLPLRSEKFTLDQWLILELAALRDKQIQEVMRFHEKQMSVANETQTAQEKIEHFTRLLQLMQLEGRLGAGASLGACRLSRGRNMDDPVILDCQPQIHPTSIRDYSEAFLGATQRAVLGFLWASIPLFSAAEGFFSLVKTQRASSGADDNLELFVIDTDCALRSKLPVKGSETAVENLEPELIRQEWTEEQQREIENLGKTILELYATGRKDRRVHTQEKHVRFVETDDSLVAYVDVRFLSRRQRRVLGLRGMSDAELVLTFTDKGGIFKPFHKFGGGVTALRSVNTEDAAETANPSGTEKYEDQPDVVEQERITNLQAVWKQVSEPVLVAMRQVAIQTVMWELAFTVVISLVLYVVRNTIGNSNGIQTAEELRQIRVDRMLRAQDEYIAMQEFDVAGEAAKVILNPEGVSEAGI